MNKLPNKMWVGLMAMTFAMTAASALAGQKGDGKPTTSEAISFEEFKGRCEHPKDFDKQVAPENISISCTDVSTQFVPDAPGKFQMLSTRKVTAGVFSSKWHVGGVDAKDVPVAQDSGSCLRFKEVERTLTESRQVSCAEILNMKGDLDEFCGNVLDASKAQHPKLIETKDTGRVVDTCAGMQLESAPTGKGMY